MNQIDKPWLRLVKKNIINISSIITIISIININTEREEITAHFREH